MQREAAEKSLSLFEYSRLKLVQNRETKSDETSTVSVKIDRLESQISNLATAVKSLAASSQLSPQLAETIQGFGKLMQMQTESDNNNIQGLTSKIETLASAFNEVARRQEETQKKLELAESANVEMMEGLKVLIGFLSEQSKKQQQAIDEPFGMRLKFIQGTMLALNALARGTQERTPDAWKPFLEFAKERSNPAFKQES